MLPLIVSPVFSAVVAVRPTVHVERAKPMPLHPIQSS